VLAGRALSQMMKNGSDDVGIGNVGYRAQGSPTGAGSMVQADGW